MKKMINHTHLCVDLKTNTKKAMKANRPVRGELTMTEENEKFCFEEIVPTHAIRPELHWRLIDRTKHGKASVNSRHVKVEFYIHHDEYQNAAELADMLAQEIEVMGENLCNMNLKEEVDKCC